MTYNGFRRIALAHSLLPAAPPEPSRTPAADAAEPAQPAPPPPPQPNEQAAPALRLDAY